TIECKRPRGKAARLFLCDKSFVERDLPPVCIVAERCFGYRKCHISDYPGDILRLAEGDLFG
ncbi:MAG TPA: hypothetical protein VGN36_08880, partial [Sphingorhabdus sp.]|nr:hypothetical protein [Sphingorhabdus sp.]